ncbi:unnamed protein product [Moneuplotes crassus]|uniref:Uncharacterized protein n=1 Tax=Euplotes crassus TaxID=5936 RepID=A0AAD2CW77_EUPCR|nr:unnamed protein product [Moneuplotes crassus]
MEENQVSEIKIKINESDYPVETNSEGSNQVIASHSSTKAGVKSHYSSNSKINAKFTVSPECHVSIPSEIRETFPKPNIVSKRVPRNRSKTKNTIDHKYEVKVTPLLKSPKSQNMRKSKRSKVNASNSQRQVNKLLLIADKGSNTKSNGSNKNILRSEGNVQSQFKNKKKILPRRFLSMKNYIRSITIDINKRNESKYQEASEFENQVSDGESVEKTEAEPKLLEPPIAGTTLNYNIGGKEAQLTLRKNSFRPNNRLQKEIQKLVKPSSQMTKKLSMASPLQNQRDSLSASKSSNRDNNPSKSLMIVNKKPALSKIMMNTFQDIENFKRESNYNTYNQNLRFSHKEEGWALIANLLSCRGSQTQMMSMLSSNNDKKYRKKYKIKEEELKSKVRGGNAPKVLQNSAKKLRGLKDQFKICQDHFKDYVSEMQDLKLIIKESKHRYKKHVINAFFDDTGKRRFRSNPRDFSILAKEDQNSTVRGEITNCGSPEKKIKRQLSQVVNSGNTKNIKKSFRGQINSPLSNVKNYIIKRNNTMLSSTMMTQKEIKEESDVTKSMSPINSCSNDSSNSNNDSQSKLPQLSNDRARLKKNFKFEKSDPRSYNPIGSLDKTLSPKLHNRANRRIQKRMKVNSSVNYSWMTLKKSVQYTPKLQKPIISKGLLPRVQVLNCKTAFQHNIEGQFAFIQNFLKQKLCLATVLDGQLAQDFEDTVTQAIGLIENFDCNNATDEIKHQERCRSLDSIDKNWAKSPELILETLSKLRNLVMPYPRELRPVIDCCNTLVSKLRPVGSSILQTLSQEDPIKKETLNNIILKRKKNMLNHKRKDELCTTMKTKKGLKLISKRKFKKVYRMSGQPFELSPSSHSISRRFRSPQPWNFSPIHR